MRGLCPQGPRFRHNQPGALRDYVVGTQSAHEPARCLAVAGVKFGGPGQCARNLQQGSVWVSYSSQEPEGTLHRHPAGFRRKSAQTAGWATHGGAAAQNLWSWPQDMGQAAVSLLLDLAQFYEHVEHDQLSEQGKMLSFLVRLLSCWCGSCATYPFCFFVFGLAAAKRLR